MADTWLNVYNTSGTLLARISEYKLISECSIRSNTFGILKFRIHQDAEGRDQLVKRYWIEVYRNGNTVWSGVICHMRKSFDEAGDPTRFYEVSARCFNWLPYWRVIVPVSGQDYLVKSGEKVDDAVKFMVREQMETGEVDDADRALTGFSVEADDTEHGDTKTLAARYDANLGDLLFKWASAYDLDWWVEADCPNATFVLRTKVPRRGTDKSASVVFTVGRHNLVALEYYEDDLDTASLVYVGGPGAGAQVVREVYDGAEPTGWDRREKFVLMSNAEYADELDAAGHAWLDSFGDTLTGVRFTLTVDEAAKWPNDFDIGDVVTVYDADFGVDKAAEIKEVDFTVDEDGQETITLLVGEPAPSKWDLLQAGLGQFSSFDDNSPPATPSSLSDATATVTDDRGNQTGSLRLNWGDNSELDLGGYQAEARLSTEAKWKTQRVTASEAVFEGFPLGSSVYARVKARDTAGNESAYANFNSGNLITMPTDTTAPAFTTNPPTVTAAKKGVRISFTRPTEKDWAYTEFYCSTAASPTTLVHSGKTTVFTFNTTSYTLHRARYKHYDEAGNTLGYSSVGSATPERVEGGGGDGDITPGTVIDGDIVSIAATKITAGTLAAGVIYAGEVAAEKITAGTLIATVLVEAASIKAGSLSVALTLAVGGSLSVAGAFTINNSQVTIIGSTALKFLGNGAWTPTYIWQSATGHVNVSGTFEVSAFIASGYATFESQVRVRDGASAAIEVLNATGAQAELKNVAIDVTTVGVSGEWDIDQVLDCTGLKIEGTERLTADGLKNVDINAATVTVDGNWDIGSHNLRAQTLQSDVATGTAPLTVASTTKVTNLNADLLDSYTATTTETPQTVVVRDGTSDINVHDVNKSGSSSAVVPTSQGKVRIIGIESPEVWFVDVIDGEVDTLFREVCEGDMLFLPMYSARKRTQPVKWLAFGKRRGYGNVRFERLGEGAYGA